MAGSVSSVGASVPSGSNLTQRLADLGSDLSPLSLQERQDLVLIYVMGKHTILAHPPR